MSAHLTPEEKRKILDHISEISSTGTVSSEMMVATSRIVLSQALRDIEKRGIRAVLDSGVGTRLIDLGTTILVSAANSRKELNDA